MHMTPFKVYLKIGIIRKKGSYSAEGIAPQIEGGSFIVGKFEDTLPKYFSKSCPTASVINFYADLYSST